MTLDDFVRTMLPPAPETVALRRLRHWSSALAVVAAVGVALVSLGNMVAPVFVAALVPVMVIAGLLTTLYWRRRAAHEDAYWTPARIEAHFAARDPKRSTVAPNAARRTGAKRRGQ